MNRGFSLWCGVHPPEYNMDLIIVLNVQCIRSKFMLRQSQYTSTWSQRKTKTCIVSLARSRAFLKKGKTLQHLHSHARFSNLASEPLIVKIL